MGLGGGEQLNYFLGDICNTTNKREQKE